MRAPSSVIVKGKSVSFRHIGFQSISFSMSRREVVQGKTPRPWKRNKSMKYTYIHMLLFLQISSAKIFQVSVMMKTILPFRCECGQLVYPISSPTENKNNWNQSQAFGAEMKTLGFSKESNYKYTFFLRLALEWSLCKTTSCSSPNVYVVGFHLRT